MSLTSLFLCLLFFDLPNYAFFKGGDLGKYPLSVVANIRECSGGGDPPHLLTFPSPLNKKTTKNQANLKTPCCSLCLMSLLPCA